jgi:hypothetical protein
MVLDITNPNNVDTDLFRRRWEHFEFAYVSELVKGEKNPVWLRKIVNVLFHVNIYKNGLTPPHCQVVMMPPSSDRVVWPNAIRQCFIDILGGVTLIMYDTVEHATAGCEQERSRTTEHKSKFEHINWLVTDHTTVAGVIQLKTVYCTINLHIAAGDLWADSLQKSLCINLFNGAYVDQLVVLNCAQVLTHDFTPHKEWIRHFNDIMCCILKPDKTFKIPMAIYDNNQDDKKVLKYLTEKFGWDKKNVDVLYHHTDPWPPILAQY